MHDPTTLTAKDFEQRLAAITATALRGDWGQGESS